MSAPTAIEPVLSGSLTLAECGHNNANHDLQPNIGSARPQVRGKFLFVNNRKLWIRGVTYGTFRPNGSEDNYFRAGDVDQDFTAMVANGINAVRTYTVPPRWFLDLAESYGLRIMVGLPWEQHIAFLDDLSTVRSIVSRVRTGVRQCAGHPAILCYAIGNEIPASIVRWYGPRRIENFLKRLFHVTKAEDPDGLVTYVNYPTTEYLDLSFADIFSFNVYLETQKQLAAYLARLHNIAGDRPVIMAEIGLDSRRNGLKTQAEVLDWQVRTTFASGCSGVFVFAWTDEWYRGGHEIEDWDFGLTTRDRQPKPALSAVQDTIKEVPFGADMRWPRISVVVCSYNGARTIRDTMEGLQKLDYSDYEIIVVDDGSVDTTAAIAEEYPVRLIRTENRGLSAARNTGLAAADGEIVAYIDDDAYPDPHWLQYVAWQFKTSDHAGVGGPNIAPPGGGRIADCVANAPGGPAHVLLSDTVAEHIPGCNMAFRKHCLEAVGGFDPRFRAAGDDVDLCWQLQERGWSLGLSPAAMVWHHRRNSVRDYWRQQLGYGKAEALLADKWPEKYNASGHVSWPGRIYGQGLTKSLGFGSGRIYQGTWGHAPFQRLYEATPDTVLSLPLMPEWILVIAGLGAFSALGVLWAPLFWALPLLALAIAAPLTQACLSAVGASFTSTPSSRTGKLKLLALTAALHLVQPVARLLGRLRYGLTPWRGLSGWVLPRPIETTLWCEQWTEPTQRLEQLELALRSAKAPTLKGGDYDRWDLEVRGGILGGARVRMAVEEHGAGRQFVRFRIWPSVPAGGIVATLVLAALAAAAALDAAGTAAGILGIGALLVVIRVVQDCGSAQAVIGRALAACKADWIDA